MSRRWSRQNEPGRPLFASGGVATSRESDQRANVLAYLQQRGATGATRDEIATSGIGVPLQSICPIVLELLRDGRLIETDATRPTRAGRPARVLILAGIASAGSTSGDLVPRQFPARGELLARSAEENTARLRREAAAERIILAGRRDRKSDDEIRSALALAGLEWPK